MFENIYQKIEELEASQDKANNLYLDSKVKLDISSELEEMYMIKSSMLCQSARANWALRGEKNTRFFHKTIAKRRSSSRILGLQVRNSLEAGAGQN